MRHALVCGITANYDFALAALLIGLRRHNPDLMVDVVVFHDGLTAAQQQQLAQLGLPLHFRPFGAKDLAARLPMPGHGPAARRLDALLARFSPLVLAKLDLPDLLDSYDRVVWMDVDMLVQGPLPDLFRFDALAWRGLPGGWQARRAPLLAAADDLWRDRTTPFPNAGLIGIARGTGLRSCDLYAIADRLLRTVKFDALDEAVWFLAAASRHIPVQQWPPGYNHPCGRDGSDSAPLVHAIGPAKFWNTAVLRDAFAAWSAHQDAWMALGGQPWQGAIAPSALNIATPAARINAALCHDDWLRVFDHIRADFPAGLLPDLRSHGPDWTIWIAGLGDDPRIVLTRTHAPDRLRGRLVITVPPASAQGDRVRAMLDAVAQAAGLDAVLHRNRIEYGAVMPLAQVAGRLALLRDLGLRLRPQGAE